MANTQPERIDLSVMYIGNHYWGKGKTIKEAKAQYRESAGRFPDKSCSLYIVSNDYYIDEMGMGHGAMLSQLIQGPDNRN